MQIPAVTGAILAVSTKTLPTLAVKLKVPLIAWRKEVHRIITTEECKIPHCTSESWEKILQRIASWPDTEITGGIVRDENRDVSRDRSNGFLNSSIALVSGPG